MTPNQFVDPPAARVSREDASWLRPELVAPWRVIILVALILIGPFAWRSTSAALQGSSHNYVDLLMSNSRLLFTGVFEGLLLAGFLGFLHWRGWKRADFKIKMTVWGSFQAILLLILTELGNGVTVLGLTVWLFSMQTQYATFLSYLIANNPHLKHHSIEVSWPVLIVTMILNAFFEELICMGYFFNQFAAKQGPLFALLLTVLLRMSCHTYQGPVHILGIGVLFSIYGLWYWQTRNLWPLIVAHALLDLGSVGLLKTIYS